MKYVLFLGACFLFTAISCTSDGGVSPGTRTTMEVQDVYDAGEVVKGEFVTAKIKVTNTGDYPLSISDVKVSCSCTVVEKPEEPIAPGESTEIVAQVDTDKTRVGNVTKTVTIVSNTDTPTKIVTIKAKVLKN